MWALTLSCLQTLFIMFVIRIPNRSFIRGQMMPVLSYEKIQIKENTDHSSRIVDAP